jgi:hypothetical protein
MSNTQPVDLDRIEALLAIAEDSKNAAQHRIDATVYISNFAPAMVAELRALRKVLFHVWEWFDDHDDRMTSAELHRMLKETIQP